MLMCIFSVTDRRWRQNVLLIMKVIARWVKGSQYEGFPTSIRINICTLEQLFVSEIEWLIVSTKFGIYQKSLKNATFSLSRLISADFKLDK